MTPRRLGCQSRDDAIARVHAFLDQISADHRRACVTRLLTDDPVDVDDLDAFVAWWQAHDRRVVDAVCQQFAAWCARPGGRPPFLVAARR
jgi:hypothetical protein